MSSPQELHISFQHSGIDYDINLVRGQESNHAVKINGITYAVLGEKEKLEIACQILASVSLDSIANSEDLKERLSLCKNISFPLQTQKTDDIGIKSLGTKQESHVWKSEEANDLPKMAKMLAKYFWNGKKANISPRLKEFLGEKEVKQAVETDNFKAFLSLFKRLSTDEIWSIRARENFNPLGCAKTEQYEITEIDKANLKQYLDDVGFSGVITLSDAKGTYSICPTKQESLENTPFSINSVAKLFTGILALMLMPPECFTLPLQLSHSTLEYLKKEKSPIYEHLQKPKLLQAMTHNAGFGDYLRNYENTIAEALENGKASPVINQIEDFLHYADTTIHDLDQGEYSNLGILLVGLAIQYHNGKPFDQILEEKILTPANINLSKSKPDNGRSNVDDLTQGRVTGGPSGGYWTTANELGKLGPWLQKKWEDEPEFRSSIKKYGREFFDLEDEEIRHNGNSTAGSSFFSTFFNNGMTVSILSDQKNFMADRIFYTIRKNIIEKKN